MAHACRNVSVVVVDDYAGTRKFIASLLQDKGMQVIGEACDGCEAVSRCQQLQPQIVVLDISMPVLDGLAAARQIVQLVPGCKIIFLTVHGGAEYAREAFRAGGLGYVSKYHALRELPEAVEAALQGKTYLCGCLRHLNLPPANVA